MLCQQTMLMAYITDNLLIYHYEFQIPRSTNTGVFIIVDFCVQEASSNIPPKIIVFDSWITSVIPADVSQVLRICEVGCIYTNNTKHGVNVNCVADVRILCFHANNVCGSLLFFSC